jgi:putative transposase
MALRWCAAGMVQARQFRRVVGHLHLARLRQALEAEFSENPAVVGHTDEVTAA